jgi:hypothetical protein
VAIAFMQEYLRKWAHKVCEKHGLCDEAEDEEPADWWKTAD